MIFYKRLRVSLDVIIPIKKERFQLFFSQFVFYKDIETLVNIGRTRERLLISSFVLDVGSV